MNSNMVILVVVAWSVYASIAVALYFTYFQSLSEYYYRSVARYRKGEEDFSSDMFNALRKMWWAPLFWPIGLPLLLIKEYKLSTKWGLEKDDIFIDFFKGL